MSASGSPVIRRDSQTQASLGGLIWVVVLKAGDVAEGIAPVEMWCPRECTGHHNRNYLDLGSVKFAGGRWMPGNHHLDGWSSQRRIFFEASSGSVTITPAINAAGLKIRATVTQNTRSPFVQVAKELRKHFTK